MYALFNYFSERIIYSTFKLNLVANVLLILVYLNSITKSIIEWLVLILLCDLEFQF